MSRVIPNPTDTWRAAPRIAMSLLVRDEIDLIRENITFHAAQGVDCFVVIDNGSRDGTREAVAALQRDYEIEIVDQPGDDYRQNLWTTDAARRVAASGKADYIISNDADEFWVAHRGDLKDALREAAPVVSVSRSNMLPFADDIHSPGFKFYDAIMNVVRPYGVAQPRPDPRDPLDAPMMLRTMLPKVACRLDGLRALAMGNHEVDHSWDSPSTSADLHIYHFPVWPYPKFLRKLEFARAIIAAGSQPKPGTLWHWRRWVAQQDLGLLYEEYRSYLLYRNAAARLEAAGIIARDESVRRFFAG